jgi:thioredoxin 1
MAGKSTLELTDETFESEVLKSDQPVLVDFWAEWCGPCRMLAPTIEQVAGSFAGRAKVGKIDTDSHRLAASRYGISALPTVLIFKGGQVVDKLVGLRPKGDYESALNRALGQA